MFEKPELNCGKSLRQGARLLLVRPPYNVQRIRDIDHAAHETFEMGDMENMALFCKNAINGGEHGHFFCTTLKFFT